MAREMSRLKTAAASPLKQMIDNSQRSPRFGEEAASALDSVVGDADNVVLVLEALNHDDRL